MDAAASLIAIVGLALSSTKVLYQTVASLRNRSEIVQETAKSLEQVADALQLLKDNQHLVHQDIDFENLLKTYNYQIQKLQDTISKVQSSPDDTRRRRLWRHVKAHLQEHDLERINEWALRQLSNFSVHLDIAAGQKAISCLQSLQRLESSAKLQLRNASSISQDVQRSNTWLGAIQEAQDRNQDAIVLGIKDVAEKVESLRHASSDQFQTLISEFRQFEILTKEPKNSVCPGQRSFSSQGVQVSAEHLQPGSENMHQVKELDEALGRLCSYADESEQMLHEDEAEFLIEDLDRILGLLDDRSTKKRWRNDLIPVNAQSREVKRAKRVISAAEMATVNAKTSRLKLDKLYKRSSVFNEYSTRMGQMTVHVVHAHLKRQSRLINSLEYGDRALQKHWGLINLVTKQSAGTSISVAFMQEIYAKRSLTFAPRVIVSPTIPADAEVFSLISKGDLEAFKQLLANKEVTMSMRDPCGRSLLNYAISSRHPHICKYLIDEGADVDFIEPHMVGQLPYHSLRLCRSWEDGLEGAMLHECEKLLLEAGADPCISTPYHTTMLTFLWRGSKAEHLKLCFNLSKDYFDINEPIPDFLSLPPLLYVLGYCYWLPETIRVILQYGSQVTHQSQHGRTAFHYVLRGSRRARIEEIQEVLCMLIKAGADPFAQDGRGLIPSHYVCNRKFRFWKLREEPRECKDCGVFSNADLKLRQIWVQALDSCGYNAESIIRQSVGDGIAEHGWTGKTKFDGDGLHLSEESSAERNSELSSYYDSLCQCAGDDDYYEVVG